MKLKTLIKATAAPLTHNGVPSVSNVQVIARASEILLEALATIKEIEERGGGDVYGVVKTTEIELMLLEKEIV